jgi:hypothetical protein
MDEADMGADDDDDDDEWKVSDSLLGAFMLDLRARGIPPAPALAPASAPQPAPIAAPIAPMSTSPGLWYRETSEQLRLRSGR